MRLNQYVLVINIVNNETMVMLLVYSQDDGLDGWITFDQHSYSSRQQLLEPDML